MQAFSAAGVRFLIVGGYATIAHGHTRATDDLADPYSFFRIGDAAGRTIDIMGGSEGLDFSRCWQNRYEADFFGVWVPFLGLRDLIRNKKRMARHIDLADVESLQALHRIPDEDEW